MMRDVFVKKIVVDESHIDALNHVNNVTYVKWIQDIAGEHWLHNTTDQVGEKVYWVVKRHVVEYKLPCFLGDELTIKSQTPPTYHGALWDRYIWIYKEGERLAVEATTTWCMMDAIKHRPSRINESIHRIFIESENE